jgi:hypothetical protein
VGDVVRANVASYPNVTRWMSTMRTLGSWRKVHEAVDGFAASLGERQFLAF